MASVSGSVNSIVYEPGSSLVAYAGTGGGVVYKTTDGGGSWSPTATIGFSLSAVAVSPTTTTSVYVGGNSFVIDIGPATTRVIGLSGNLAFGNVPAGTSATSTLTIGNTGNSPLTVTSISYPTGFSGAFAGAIPAGGSQNVTVTFAPAAAIGYGGTVTVNADQTSGTNTISASGTGTTLVSPLPTAAVMTSPAPGSTLRATTATFEWTGGIGVMLRYLQVGTAAGGGELYNADPGATSLRATVTGLPSNGSPVYVRLWSLVGGAWQFRDATYTATSGGSAKAELASPAPLSTLTATSLVCESTGGRNVTRYWLWIGSTLGGADLWSQDQGTNLRTTVTGLPADGRTLYVRLWSVIGGVWQFTDSTVKAVTGSSARGELTHPGAGLDARGLDGGVHVDRWDERDAVLALCREHAGRGRSVE